MVLPGPGVFEAVVGTAQSAVAELCHIAMPLIPTLSVPFYRVHGLILTVTEGDDAKVDGRVDSC